MSDLIGFVEGLAAQLEALGHGDSPMVRHAREAATRAKEAGEVREDFARLDADVLEAFGRLRRIEDAARRAEAPGYFYDAVLARCDLMELLGLWSEERIATTRKIWRGHKSEAEAQRKGRRA